MELKFLSTLRNMLLARSNRTFMELKLLSDNKVTKR